MKLDHFPKQEAIQKNKYLIATIALIITPISGMAIDIYVPSLPAVRAYFNVDQALAQLTITSYMIGFGFFQLFAGSLSDSFGRKKPFVITMITFILASLLIPFSTSIYQLMFLRLVQGISVACLNVPMRAVISDMFSGLEFYKIMNYMTIVWAMGPIIAPAIGGYLQYYFGWPAPFYFLAAYGTLMLILNLLFMPETAETYHPFKMIEIAKRFRLVLFHREYAVGLICLGMLYSLLVLFGLVGPFLIQNVMHYSPIAFGHMALLMGLGWFLGNMTNRFLINVNLDKKVMTCFVIMLFITLIMLIAALIFHLNIYAIIIPNFILLYFAGMVFPNFFAKNVALFPNVSGTANALMGAFMVLIAACSTAVGTLLESNTQTPLTLAYMVITLICLAAFFVDVSKRKSVT